MMMSELKILVKPTQRCNLRCQYCYDRQFGVKCNMTLATVRDICTFATRSSNHITWIWHGGEPTLMPIEFYREANNILKEFNITHVSMQSNAINMTEEFAQMAKDFHWSIAFSFDGRKQDINRGHSAKVLKGIQTYQNVCGSTGIIKVVDASNVKDFHEDYEYMKEVGIKSFQINRIFQAPDAKMIDDKTLNEYLESYALLLDKWLNDPEPIDIRNYREFIGFILGTSGFLCNSRGNCVKQWMSVNPLGYIYPCDRWYSDEFIYGHITDYFNFEQMTRKSEAYKMNLAIQKKRMRYCKDEAKCEIFPYCNGGCNVNAILNNGGNRPDENDCKIRKKEFYHIFNLINTIDPNTIKNPEVQKILLKAGIRNTNLVKEEVKDGDLRLY